MGSNPTEGIIKRETPKCGRVILVLCPNWVGDMVMATPLFDCLRHAYAGDRLVAVARNYVRGVLEPNPWFDQVISSDDKSLGGFSGLVRKIQRMRPDLALVLPNSMRSALIAKFGGSRKIIGYLRGGRSLLIDEGPRPEKEGGKVKPVPMAHYYMKFARWLKLPPPQHIRPRLFISEAQSQAADALMARWGIGSGDAIVALNPGARFGSSKCWPAENFARLAERLAQRWSCKILLLIGPGEETLGRRITELSRAEIVDTGADRIDLATLKPLIARCRLLITNDTGPRHYAVALGVPAIVMMGPTDPRYTQANLSRTMVLRHDLDCAPCHKKRCPRDHECMTAITPQTVMDAAETLYETDRKR